ncbi:bifunctional folylpolyglutamate synthase/dihydrofolate synthase [Aureibacter tunicatorum]|uniref:Dihydrofolate synthase/folylpolyglutamate synthase n=1 Tax=Aureibacter tunicatorum TaxID=866807 RepID=A0AAE4BT54_9BACT|nr:folylpolyglutamate synthase/dihydrofolate synthase family protein [Aureibacter tunicatorum]MDR6239605.1 dihydrofolate synthase/folylpolyglutamate synthase [Aureibacter tunicatorum]BDD04082.1 tetrahydrofolate synthase [Aureibacter tunicatorum]
MNYNEAVDFLYNALPMYQREGKAAYKTDMDNTIRLCEGLGNPQNNFKTIHVAGTNGKGSSSHMIASILQEAGYKVGLYTSPHLKEFTERIKINGKEISQEAVVSFVENHKSLIEEVMPSFFEMTVGMAFQYFDLQKVDVAVIEVGLGGRLDSTNIITPETCLITNISKDHQALLGDTLEKIAAEKAGIIKPKVPVIVSQTQSEVEKVFKSKAENCGSEILFADKSAKLEKAADGRFVYNDNLKFELGLHGNYQQNNALGVLALVEQFLMAKFPKISNRDIENGLKNIVLNTGLKGRWQQIGSEPEIICDTGHNEDGVRLLMDQIRHKVKNKLHIVWGMVDDKDVVSILNLLPKDASFYFCMAENSPRAIKADALARLAKETGLTGESISNVNDAIAIAKSKANKDDLIFVGGSTFVVAEIKNL